MFLFIINSFFFFFFNGYLIHVYEELCITFSRLFITTKLFYRHFYQKNVRKHENYNYSNISEKKIFWKLKIPFIKNGDKNI
jgi:hypothetical protein